MKPSEYIDLRVISADTPYQVLKGQSDGSQTDSGMLQAGRCVWIEHRLAVPTSQVPVPAYVEGIGIVSLSLHSLYPGAGGTA